ncbi:MAG: hypothetical protein JSW39_08185 [Desulfobacterales bacterium]|nr:MAG: hypothetical protein JSW39_08185 [Desulfobacterales bacterium]
MNVKGVVIGAGVVLAAILDNYPAVAQNAVELRSFYGATLMNTLIVMKPKGAYAVQGGQASAGTQRCRV